MTLTKKSTTNIGGPVFGLYNIRVSGSYAYICTINNGCLVYDISNPLSPSHVASMNSGGVDIYDCKIDGNYIYLAAWDTDAIEVWDITDPTNPVYKTQISGSGSPNYLSGVSSVFIDGNYIFAISQFDQALVSINISNPLSPTLGQAVQPIAFGADNGYLWDLVIVDNHAYFTIDGDDVLLCYDVSNPLSMVAKDTFSGAGSPNYMHSPLRVTVDGNYAYVGVDVDEGLTVVNISDKSNFTYESGIYGTGSPNYIEGWGSVKEGNYVFMSSYLDDTFTVLDVSTPNSPTFVETLYDSDFDELYRTEISGDYAYCIDVWNLNLIIIDISDYTGTGIQVGDTVLLIPNYGDTYDRAAIKGGAISTGDNVQLYPLKGGAKVAIKEEWSAGDKIIF